MHIVDEVMSFLCSCVVGMVLGAFFDCFRILRLAVKSPKILVFIEDVLFFIVAAIATLYIVLEQSNGTVRVFLLFGELLGLIIYFYSIGILVIKSAKFIISVFKKFFAIVFYPLRKLGNFVLKSASALHNKISLFGKNKLKNIENH